jgi:hypothetical protein
MAARSKNERNPETPKNMSNPKIKLVNVKTEALRTRLREMDGPTFREVRDGYYQAAQGLASLLDGLKASGMKEEAAAVQKAIDALDSTRIGVVA